MFSGTHPSQLYAFTHNYVCEGSFHCHWCGMPCGNLWRHDDPPLIIGVRSKSGAKYPNEPYLCWGCWLYRFKRTTVTHLSSGQFTDGQTPPKHSWWITEAGCWSIRPPDYPVLLEKVRNPPLRFTLALIDPHNGPNWLHYWILNDHAKITPMTTHQFTFNNVRHVYSIAELEDCLAGKAEGKEAGSRLLADLLRPPAVLSLSDRTDKRDRGRPWEEDQNKRAKKIIRASGVAV